MTMPLIDRYGRWGRPDHPVEVSATAEEFLSSRLGTPAPRPGAAPTDVRLPASRLGDAVRAALVAVVGAQWVGTDDADRIAHLGGCSLADYVERREGLADIAPDAVLRPGSTEDVLVLLRVAAEHGVAVVPFGGGTSVVGGVAPLTGRHGAVIALEMSRMARVLGVDETNATVTVQPGVTGPVLERLLESRGFTWGHLPQSWERASVGGYVATRSAGQASSGYGRSDDTVVAVQVATPSGLLSLGRAPACAAGPDLRQLFVGSEGVFGVITEVTLRIRHLPAYQRYEGLMFPRYSDGIDAFRALAQAGLKAAVMRLSDPAETRTTLAMSGPGGAVGAAFDRYLKWRNVDDGCLAVLGWEEHIPRVGRARRDAAWSILGQHGAVALGGRVGRSWRKHRFGGPYLRDELLDRGFIVETLETATSWTRLHQLHDDLTVAITGALAVDDGSAYVMSHVSHVYETGASLYLTVLAPAEADRRAQWQRAKNAAGQAITAAGATITHHHAVGTDHVPWMAAEIGPLGLDVLRAVKDRLDPAGVLNPGKVIG